MVLSRRAGLPALLAVAGMLAGCQMKPKMVIERLPGTSILSPCPPGTPEPPPRQTGGPTGRRLTRTEPGWTPETTERAWKWIVIHHSASDAGSAATFDRWHRARGWDELGYHFVITNGRGGADGVVEVGGRWGKQKQGAHTGGTPDNAYNEYGIGICLVGEFTRGMPSAAQLAGLQRLLAFLTQRYDIDPGNVIGHRDAPRASTECPGEAMERYLGGTIRPALTRQLAGKD